MHPLAATVDPASPPPGWLPWAFVMALTLLLSVVSYLYRTGRREDRAASASLGQKLEAVSYAVTEAIKTLAVLISEHGTTRKAAETAVGDIAELSEAVAVLQAWRNFHTEQSKEDHDLLQGYIRSGGVVGSGQHQRSV